MRQNPALILEKTSQSRQQILNGQELVSTESNQSNTIGGRNNKLNDAFKSTNLTSSKSRTAYRSRTPQASPLLFSSATSTASQTPDLDYQETILEGITGTNSISENGSEDDGDESNSQGLMFKNRVLNQLQKGKRKRKDLKAFCVKRLCQMSSDNSHDSKIQQYQKLFNYQGESHLNKKKKLPIVINFDKILPPQEAVQRIKLSYYLFPYSNASFEYWENYLNTDIQKRYKKSRDDDAKASRMLEKEAYGRFEVYKSKVSLFEAAQLVPHISVFPTKAISILHKDDQGYNMMELESLKLFHDKKEEEKKQELLRVKKEEAKQSKACVVICSNEPPAPIYQDDSSFCIENSMYDDYSSLASENDTEPDISLMPDVPCSEYMSPSFTLFSSGDKVQISSIIDAHTRSGFHFSEELDRNIVDETEFVDLTLSQSDPSLQNHPATESSTSIIGKHNMPGILKGKNTQPSRVRISITNKPASDSSELTSVFDNAPTAFTNDESDSDCVIVSSTKLRPAAFSCNPDTENKVEASIDFHKIIQKAPTLVTTKADTTFLRTSKSLTDADGTRNSIGVTATFKKKSDFHSDLFTPSPLFETPDVSIFSLPSISQDDPLPSSICNYPLENASTSGTDSVSKDHGLNAPATNLLSDLFPLPYLTKAAENGSMCHSSLTKTSSSNDKHSTKPTTSQGAGSDSKSVPSISNPLSAGLVVKPALPKKYLDTNILEAVEPATLSAKEAHSKSKKDFSNHTTKQLVELLDQWGFKTDKLSREQMIEKLDSCGLDSPVMHCNSGITLDNDLGAAKVGKIQEQHNSLDGIDQASNKASSNDALLENTSISNSQTLKIIPKSTEELQKLKVVDLRALVQSFGFKPTTKKNMVNQLNECYKSYSSSTGTT